MMYTWGVHTVHCFSFSFNFFLSPQVPLFFNNLKFDILFACVVYMRFYVMHVPLFELVNYHIN